MKNTKNKCAKMQSVLATQIRSICAIAILAVIGFLAACSTGDDGVTPPPVHNHVWGAWSLTTDPTCSTKGVETRVCTLDATHKETRETDIDPEAHDWELLEGTAPTCTTDGNGKEKCKLCGREEEGVLPKIGHDYGDWVTTKAPTETEDGQEERTCKHDAAHKETKAIGSLSHTHDWGDWFTATSATCTAEGESKRVCKLNENHFEIKDIAKLGHDWNDWVIVTAATCEVDGEETRTCKHDSLHHEKQDIAKLGHDYQWQATTPATFTSEGVEKEICTHDATHTRGTRISDPLPITTAAEWNAAVNTIRNGGNDKTYDINVTGEFDIAGYKEGYYDSVQHDDDYTFGTVTELTVNIRGTGTITLASGSTGSLLYIRSNQTVSLKETHLKGHGTNNTTLVYVYGTFNMSGGTISGNTASSGGGVCVAGGGGYLAGGVYEKGTFNMSGGTISDNTASRGGGVLANGNSESIIFNMSGGTISGNTASSGGGVYCAGGTFNMSGTAVISDNKATGIATGTGGGGVFMYLYSQTYFNMTGGTISGNIATGNGGGVGMGLNASSQAGNIYFNMTGGKITGNTAKIGGGIQTSNVSQFNGKPRMSVDLLSLDLVTGNIATMGDNQLSLEGGLYIDGVKQAPRDDFTDNGKVGIGDYYWR